MKTRERIAWALLVLIALFFWSKVDYLQDRDRQIQDYMALQRTVADAQQECSTAPLMRYTGPCMILQRARR